MIRFLFIAFLLALTIWLVVQASRHIARAGLDWKGIAMAGGFVAMAFYLRHVTGWG
jgi:hypothetical protein